MGNAYADQRRKAQRRRNRRDDRLADALNIAASGASLLSTEDGWMDFLRLIQRIPGLSLENALVLLRLRPDATAIGTFGHWRDHGRFIRRGEIGTRIVLDEGRTTTAFDISQTEPYDPLAHPIPEAWTLFPTKTPAVPLSELKTFELDAVLWLTGTDLAALSDRMTGPKPHGDEAAMLVSAEKVLAHWNIWSQ